MPAGLFFSLDASAIARLGNLIQAAGVKAPAAIARAVNRTGDMATTKMVRTLTSQTGLKRRTIVKALRKYPAAPGALTYEIRSAGGDVSLKYFGAREVKGGVSAAPFGHRSVYGEAFMKGGRWGARVPLPKLNGHVYKRAGSGKLPIVKVKSGVVIPAEMVKGVTAAAFYETVNAVLPGRLSHELGRVIGGG